MSEPVFGIISKDMEQKFTDKFSKFMLDVNEIEGMNISYFLSIMVQNIYEIYDKVEGECMKSPKCDREKVEFLHFAKALLDEYIKRNKNIGKNDSIS